MNVARRPLQYSLATILQVTALAACCLAVMRLTPFWGTAALLVSALALLRNALVARVYPMDVATIRQKLELFLESVSVVLLCVVVAGVGLVLSGSVAILVGLLSMSPGIGPPFDIVAAGVGLLFCVAWTIVPFIYTFWKLTFPVRSQLLG